MTPRARAPPRAAVGQWLDGMIEVVCNDRLGKKLRVKCNADDTVGDFKKLLAAQTGTRPEKLRLQKWHTVYKDHITLEVREMLWRSAVPTRERCAVRRGARRSVPPPPHLIKCLLCAPPRADRRPLAR